MAKAAPLTSIFVFMRDIYGIAGRVRATSTHQHGSPNSGLAGILGEVFVREMTSVRVRRVRQGGALRGGARVHASGRHRVRCCHCDSVLLVVANTGETSGLGLGKAKWLDFVEWA